MSFEFQIYWVDIFWFAGIKRRLDYFICSTVIQIHNFGILHQNAHGSFEMGFMMQIWLQTPSELLVNLFLFPFEILQVFPFLYVLALLDLFLKVICVRIKLLFLPQLFLLQSNRFLFFEFCLGINIILLPKVPLIVFVVQLLHLTNCLITHIRLFWRYWFYLLEVLLIVKPIPKTFWEVDFCVQYARLNIVIRRDRFLEFFLIVVSVSESSQVYVIRISVWWVSGRRHHNWGKFHPRSIVHRWLS